MRLSNLNLRDCALDTRAIKVVVRRHHRGFAIVQRERFEGKSNWLVRAELFQARGVERPLQARGFLAVLASATLAKAGEQGARQRFLAWPTDRGEIDDGVMDG